MQRPILLRGISAGAVFVVGIAAARSPIARLSRGEVVALADGSAAAAPLPHLSGTDLLSAFYGKRVTKADSGALRVLIVTVPDPISSRLDWSYDAQLESLRRALEHSGYVIDRFWLPWHTTGDTAAARLGVADSLPAAQWPGVLLFRRKNPLESSIVLAYVVGEVPTSGVHSRAMRVALDERRRLLAHDSASKWSDTLRIVGPAFSGSSLSLRRAIGNWRDSTGDTSFVEIVTGSASDSTNLHIFDVPRLRFRATVHTSSWLEAAAESLIVRRLDISSAELAFLHEGTTQYGQAAGSHGKNPPSPRAASLQPLMLAFPMSISSLQVQYARHPEPAVTSQGRDAAPAPAGPRLALDQREPASLTESPAVLSALTAPAAELLLAQLERSLVAHHIRAVGILATDIRDELFLADEIRKRLRDVQIFFYGSNVLLLRPEYQAAVEGSLVLSTYPLVLENQYWDLTKGDHERLLFMSDEAEGFFNATLFQLGNSRAMTEYVSPMEYRGTPGSAAPPTWVTVVGHDAIYPVTLVGDTAAVPAAAERRYVLERDADPMRSFTERSRPAWQFLAILGLLLTAFVGSFVVLQRRTVPRVNAIVASPSDGLFEGQPNSPEERRALLRAARWASLLLHRELYVLLRFFSLFAAFSAGLLLLLRPRAHGVVSPNWGLAVLAVVSGFLTLVIFKRAIVQSAGVLSIGRDHGTRFVFAGVWPRRRDRVLWFLEIGARFAVLVAGLSYFLLTLIFLGQVLGLDSRSSAFFFQRAVSIGGGVSPAVPLVLSAVGFATWCSWHLMRIALLAEPTVYEEFLLRRAANETRLKGAKRRVRDHQHDAEREARHALRLCERAVVAMRNERSDERTGGSQAAPGRKARAETSAELLARARDAATSASQYVNSAEDVIARAQNDTPHELWTSDESPFLETRDIRRAAVQASRAVERAEAIFRQYGGNDASKPAAPAAAPPAESADGRGVVARVSDAVRRVSSVGGVAPAVGRGYRRFENWYDRSHADDRATQRSSSAARDLADMLFYLVPNGPAFGMLMAVVAMSIWLGTQFELSLESLTIARFDWLGGVTSFDALFRFGILALTGVTAWAVYRLAGIWSGIQTILAEITPDLLPSFVALPQKLARVTRLTAFGHASRSDIEEVVEIKWKAMRRALSEVPKDVADEVNGLVGHGAFDRPAVPRSRPYELDWDAYEDFDKLHRALEHCRLSGLLAAEAPPAGDDKAAAAPMKPDRAWARATADLYAVYVADYIDWVLQHMRYLASFLLISLVLTVILLSSYPFQPQSVLKVIYTIILVVAVATLVFVIVQMNRERVLSAIANTEGGTVSWDTRFVGLLVTYGAVPLLTLISTEFPQVRQFLFSWVAPLFRAFAKG